jgi:hypothetical protein
MCWWEIKTYNNILIIQPKKNLKKWVIEVRFPVLLPPLH